MALSDRVQKLEERMDKIEDKVFEISIKVFNGFGEKIDKLCEIIENLKTEIQEEKERKLTRKDVWLRSIVIGVGGSLIVGVILYLLPRLL